MSVSQSQSQKNELFLKLLQNDTKGIEQIYEQYFMSIYKLISKSGGNIEDAKDIFQEALIIIYQKGHSDNFTLTSSFHTLLYAICHNLWRSISQKKYRKNMPLLFIDKYADDYSIENDLVKAELEQLFLEHFNRLPLEAQQVLKLYLSGKSMNEIKNLMGYKTANYASKRKLYAKKRLIQSIKSDLRYKELMEK